LRIAKWIGGKIAQPYESGDKPRFMALGFYNPHLPLFAPQKWYDAAPTKEEVFIHATSEGDLDDLSPIAKRIASRVSFQAAADWALSTEDNLRMLTQAYLACTSAMDDALGHTIDALDHSDMSENTWIVVLSDHGWHLGEKSHIAKQTLWTRSTRVPLIIVPPKRMKDTPRGARCERAVELLDVYPTLVSVTNLPTAKSDLLLDGISLLPWIKKPSAEKERPAITTIYAHNHSLCDTRWRYTRYADGSEELYDRENDPHEFDNLIGKKESRVDLKAVVSKLSAWNPNKEPRGPDLVDDRVKK
jgi:arylsulfatase A-like enzyme